jgi:hypothetical protein
MTPADRIMAAREQIVSALATMPDEAFSWFAMATQASAMTHGALTQIWPDGTGGFTAASRAAIATVQAAAADYLKAQQGQ